MDRTFEELRLLVSTMLLLPAILAAIIYSLVGSLLRSARPGPLDTPGQDRWDEGA